MVQELRGRGDNSLISLSFDSHPAVGAPRPWGAWPRPEPELLLFTSGGLMHLFPPCPDSFNRKRSAF